LVIECKYTPTWNADYVGRSGYAQLCAYANDLLSSTVSPLVRGVVIGPEGVVINQSWAETSLGWMGVSPPGELGEVLESFVGWDESTTDS
jgi:hypothetical protein